MNFKLFFSLIFLLLLCGCYQPHTFNNELEDFLRNYNKLNIKEKSILIEQGGSYSNKRVHYLGYLVRDLAYEYHISKDKRIYYVIDDIIGYYQKNYIGEDKILRSPLSKEILTFWSRDQFAKDMKLFYEAYIYTGNIKILNLIEEQVENWMIKVPRKTNTNGRTVFPYGIDDNGNAVSYEIDPNQNIVVASIFTYLYWEPFSKYYLNENIKTIVYNEVNAALDIQKQNGSLPIREYLPLVEDTNYGGYVGDMLYQLSQLWGEKDWIEATKKIGKWLNTEYSKEHPWNIPEDAPNFSKERYTAYNLIARLIPFYAAGVPREQTLDWIEYIKTKFPNENLVLKQRIYFYRSIPGDYFGVKSNDMLNPVNTVVINNSDININVITSEVRTLEVKIKNMENGNIEELYKGSMKNKLRKTLKKGKYNIISDVTSENNLSASINMFLSVNATEDFIFNINIFDSKNPFFEY